MQPRPARLTKGSPEEGVSRAMHPAIPEMSGFRWDSCRVQVRGMETVRAMELSAPPPSQRLLSSVPAVSLEAFLDALEALAEDRKP